VIFSFAMAVKSIFTTPEKLAWKISVCPASGLTSLMTWTGVAPDLEVFACATTKGPFMTTLPRVRKAVDSVLDAIQSQ
jgi:phosphoribosylcarboxyaminoimidazole (NCAIR) mutase